MTVPDLMKFSESCAFTEWGNPSNTVFGFSRTVKKWLKERSTFRLDADGDPIAGKDVMLKSRKVYFSSAGLICLAWACCSRPKIRCVFSLQNANKEVLGEKVDEFVAMLEGLPEEWTGRVKVIGQRRVMFGNGSRVDFLTAGNKRNIAAKPGRSGTIHILWASEVPYYDYPRVFLDGCNGAMDKRTQWVVYESTSAGDRANKFDSTWHGADEGSLPDWKNHFIPWHANPAHRLAENSPAFDAYMDPDFEAEMDPLDLAAEDEFDLDPGQRAWRRQELCTGSIETRLLARREFPENPTDPYGLVARWLSVESLRTLDGRTGDADVSWDIGRVKVHIWPTRRYSDDIHFGVDPAYGKNKHAAGFVGIDTETRDVVVTALGPATPRESARVILIIRERLDLVRRQGGCGVENTLGGRAIRQLEDARVPVEQLVLTPLVSSDRLDAVASQVEGPLIDVEGERMDPKPVVDVPCRRLVKQLAGLVYDDDRGIVPGDDGNDLVQAWGNALLTAPPIGHRMAACQVGPEIAGLQERWRGRNYE